METTPTSQANDVCELLRTAIARIEIANEEGDQILSAWLPEARAMVAVLEDYDQQI
jgi:hypothetical protein